MITESKDISLDDIFSFLSCPHTSKNQHEDDSRYIKRAGPVHALIPIEKEK
jgi:hypothetical protein